MRNSLTHACGRASEFSVYLKENNCSESWMSREIWSHEFLVTCLKTGNSASLSKNDSHVKRQYLYIKDWRWRGKSNFWHVIYFRCKPTSKLVPISAIQHLLFFLQIFARCSLFDICAPLGVVIPYRRFGTTNRSQLQGPRILDYWPLQKGPIDCLRNVGKELPLRWVMTQKSADLIYMMPEAWNHTKHSI